MTLLLVLDSEALSALAADKGPRFQAVRQALEAAQRLRHDVATPAVVLAELYRGPGRNAVVDACLARDSSIRVQDTDRDFARFVGGVLAAAGAGSELMVDAHVVATALAAGGGVALTGDEQDVGRLAAPFGGVTVVGI